MAHTLVLIEENFIAVIYDLMGQIPTLIPDSEQRSYKFTSLRSPAQFLSDLLVAFKPSATEALYNAECQKSLTDDHAPEELWTTAIAPGL